MGLNMKNLVFGDFEVVGARELGLDGPIVNCEKVAPKSGLIHGYED